MTDIQQLQTQLDSFADYVRTMQQFNNSTIEALLDKITNNTSAKGAITDADVLNKAADYGVYYYIGEGAKMVGAIDVSFDFNGDVSQTMLCSTTPIYSDDGTYIQTYENTPCVIYRKYDKETETWSKWQRISGTSVELKKLGSLDDLIINISRLGNIEAVEFPRTANDVEVRIKSAGTEYQVGKLYPATKLYAGLLSPTILDKIMDLEKRVVELEYKINHTGYITLGVSKLGSEDVLH